MRNPIGFYFSVIDRPKAKRLMLTTQSPQRLAVNSIPLCCIVYVLVKHSNHVISAYVHEISMFYLYLASATGYSNRHGVGIKLMFVRTRNPSRNVNTEQ